MAKRGDLRCQRKHRAMLAVHDDAWQRMHDIGRDKGRDSPEFQGARAAVLRAFENVKRAVR
jgi:hypothetical protein